MWYPLGPPPERSAGDALRLAREVVARARREPTAFADIARTTSDDVVTSDWGGALGGLAANSFSATPQLLDALATMKPGDVSEPIPTAEGFEILLRRPTPDLARVSGRRIVLSYDGAPPGRQPDAGTGPARSRDSALAVARRVVAEARAGAAFDVLLKQYSDGPDVQQGGDLGLFSTREPERLAREIEVLAGLDEGAVSEPLDSLYGFEILQRTDALDRPLYAAASIELPFDPNAPDAEGAREAAAVRAHGVLQALEEVPAQFGAFQAVYCCKEPKRWTRGRRPPGMPAAVEKTPVGAIVHEILEFAGRFVIAKRLDPAQLPPDAEYVFDLPAPSEPDLEFWIQHARPAALAQFAGELGDFAKSVLQLDEASGRRFSEIHKNFASRAAGEGTDAGTEDRVEDLRRTLIEIKGLVGEKRFARYMDILHSRAEALLLGRQRLAGGGTAGHAGP